MKQIKVHCGKTNQIVWVDEDPRLKIGVRVRFKDEEMLWEIDEIYNTSIDKKSLYKTWHVGGL